MDDVVKHRFLVMKMVRPNSYYQSWEMLKHGHVETREDAEAIEREWHKKYPGKRTLIIETVGAPFSLCGNGPDD